MQKKVLKYINQIYKDIKSIKIQGATNIALAGINALIFVISFSIFKDKKDFFRVVSNTCKKIESARPTEPMLFNGFKYVLFNIKKNSDKDLSFLISNSIKDAKYFIELIHKNSKKSVGFGSKLVKNGDDILTHCHSSSIVKTFVAAKKSGKKFHVYNTESRPLYQGRLTSRDLVEAGIDDTMLVDSEAAYIISDASGKDYTIDKVIIGCDAIGCSGSIINKVGSYGIALACYHFGVPLYIAGDLLKIDATDNIPVESRDFKELWEKAPKGLKILNFAFDFVPAKYITGIITEFGVLKPKDVKKIAKEKYPFIFEKTK